MSFSDVAVYITLSGYLVAELWCMFSTFYALMFRDRKVPLTLAAIFTQLSTHMSLIFGLVCSGGEGAEMDPPQLTYICEYIAVLSKDVMAAAATCQLFDLIQERRPDYFGISRASRIFVGMLSVHATIFGLLTALVCLDVMKMDTVGLERSLMELGLSAGFVYSLFMFMRMRTSLNEDEITGEIRWMFRLQLFLVAVYVIRTGYELLLGAGVMESLEDESEDAFAAVKLLVTLVTQILTSAVVSLCGFFLARSKLAEAKAQRWEKEKLIVRPR